MPTTTGIATEFIQFSRTSNATVTDSDGKIKWAPANLLLNSESFDTASWTKTTTTVAANSFAAPNGTTTADTLTAAGANSTTLQSYTALAVPYTFGVWLRRKTGTGTIEIAADNGTYTAVTITSSWALYTVSQTPAAGSKSAGIRIVTSGDEVYVWGAALYRSDLGGMQPNTSAYPLYNPTTVKNMVGYSEDFTNAYWTKSSTTALATSVANPNGLSSSVLVYPSSTGSDRLVYRSPSITGVASTPYTISVYAKAAGINFLYFGTLGGGTTPSSSLAYFDLQNGVRTQVGSAFTSATITSVGNGWYRCSAVATAALATLFPVFGLADANNSVTVTASGTNGIYLWGAQLSDSASLDPYFPSYSTAPTAAAYYGPRRDFDGSTLACKGLLVEETRTNLVINSNDLGAASWTTGNATVATNVATSTSPDGTNSADKLTGDGTNAGHYIRANVTLAINTTYTFSAFVKTAELQWFYLAVAGTGASSGGAPISTFNSTTVAVGSISANIVSRNIVNIGNGWCRAQIVFTTAGTVGGNFIEMSVSTSDTTGVNTASGGILYYGIQLEAGSFSTSLMPTVATTFQRNPDVSQVSTQAFPYSGTEGTIVVSWQLAQLSGSPAAIHLTDVSENNRIRINAQLAGINRSTITAAGSLVANIDTSTAATGITKYAIGGKSADYAVYRNGSAGGTSTNAGFPSGCTELRIARDGASNYLNGHIRQITYLPRRVTDAELQTRTA